MVVGGIYQLPEQAKAFDINSKHSDLSRTCQLIEAQYINGVSSINTVNCRLL